jgi:2',3'-cyclic-nucleotide 2'-phosphodiesterase (5'-nucleotidase family)
VAFANGGGVRANIPAGDITIGQVYNVLPFGNTLSVKIITPDVLYKALEFGISGLSLDENGKVTGLVGSYPQVSGMRFEMDLTKTAYAEGVTDGERITAVYLVNQDGTETKLERTDATTQIAFASNDFLIAGGDGFTMLTNLKHILVGNVLDEVLGDYITKLTEDNGGAFTYEMPGNRSVEINQKQTQ